MTGRAWLDQTAADVRALIDAWRDARATRDYPQADALRALLANHGVTMQQRRDGGLTVYRDAPNGIGGDWWEL